MLMTDPRHLTDENLIASIATIAGTERLATAMLIAHLAELESRNLHLAQGFRSLFGYCRHVLHCSEHEAYNRMEAVHAARRFPVILALLAEGRLHLTAVRLLAPHLKDKDHLALLGGAIHKSRREIVALLARWFPSPDVASSIRKLPATPEDMSPQTEALGVSAAEEPGLPGRMETAADGSIPIARTLAARASASNGPSFGGPLPIAGHPSTGRARRSPVPAGPDAP